MIFSFTVFLRQIKPITKIVVVLLALRIWFNLFLHRKTNYFKYWERFGYKSFFGDQFFLDQRILEKRIGYYYLFIFCLDLLYGLFILPIT